MSKIARTMVATVATVVMTPLVAYAEPIMLTATQMEAITAGTRPDEININVSITTQIANARAIAIATCGVCIGSAPSAASLAAASNTNATEQLQQ